MKRILLSLGLLLGLLASAPAQSPGVNSNLASVWSIPLDSTKRTYSVAMSNLVVASSPTTWWQICGSATFTVRVTRISVSGRQTAVAAADFQAIKTSTAAAGGTIAANAPFSGVAIVGLPYDTNFAAGTAKVTAWTANPTIGTLIGPVWSGQAWLGNLTTGVGTDPVVIDFGNHPGSAVVLHGIAQCLALDSSVGTGPGSGNLMDVTTEWTEE